MTIFYYKFPCQGQKKYILFINYLLLLCKKLLFLFSKYNFLIFKQYYIFITPATTQIFIRN